LLLDSKSIQKTVQTYFQKIQQEKKKEELAKYGVYKKEGLAFLEANKTKEGVKTTESGLQYVVLKEGKGRKPKTTDRVKVHYHGTTVDGTVFDSSVDRGTPAEFGVTQVIKGWTEGLQLMKVGSKYKFFIPQELAYGENPRPGIIKPFMALIFEVELLDIK
jgi:FKBP-type peptidyl-prolyl cis-trans isomerase FklB